MTLRDSAILTFSDFHSYAEVVLTETILYNIDFCLYTVRYFSQGPTISLHISEAYFTNFKIQVVNKTQKRGHFVKRGVNLFMYVLYCEHLNTKILFSF